jgi:hypothetical protein
VCVQATSARLNEDESKRRLLAYAVAVASAAGLAGVFVASERDVDKLGFLLWFHHEGRGVGAPGLALLALFGLAFSLTAGALAGAGFARVLAVAANISVKATLAGGVLFMFAYPDLPQFDNKSLLSRAIAYPLLAGVPLALYARRRHGAYPHLCDLCWSFALTIDIVGNDLHWYGNWKHWDDTVHFLNAVPLMVLIVVAVLALERNGAVRLGFWGAALVGLAIYTSLHGMWEMEEYLLDRFAGTKLQPGGMSEATRNNLSSMAGSLLGVAALWWWQEDDVLDDAFVKPVAALLSRR